MRLEIYGLVFLIVSGGLVNGAEDALRDKCGKEFQKVVACLNFATGKAETPSKECCDSAGSIKESDPVCLCYIIEQVHSGDNSQIKSMGIQEARMLQLPSACKINDVNITSCPKLLNLPANSPDAAFFTNATTSASTTPVTTPATSSPTTTGIGGSNGFRHAPQLAGPLLVAVTIFFWTFSRVF